MAATSTTEAPASPVQFSAPTRAWFDDAFAAPTPVQQAAWQSIGAGLNTLLVAPTGSGKTLAAFLDQLDRLTTTPRTDPSKVQVLYVSPLKALAVDVDRNLTAPLRGIERAAERLGQQAPSISVGVRTGDTPQAERRRQAVKPPDILITTPESLFLMLSSNAAQTLDQLRCVIIDEIHALAGTKRGAHLMLSLERLEALRQQGPAADARMQRIGLSATVRPLERVATFLGGDREVNVVAPEANKRWDLSVQVPVEDMTQLRQVNTTQQESDDETPTQSIWPYLEERALELIDEHRTTLCFVNSRRVAERVTAHLNERHAERLGLEVAEQDVPAQVMAQSGTSRPPEDPDQVIARAHHGSVSKERRAQIEADLKSGALRCVVATSSLELGIDMGLVDQVIQIGSPPSVASGLQRVGRAGHQVGAVSEGTFLPTHRHDLLESAVVTGRMREGRIEQVHELRNPLDVLSQHLVSMCIDRSITSRDAYALVRRSAPFAQLSENLFDACLEMLTGRYPSEDFSELRPRLVWDRATDLLSARPGARRLVTTSGGTIPDRGLFGVFLAGEGEGRRVGELDEEMVYESRVGDVFTLGTSSWRIHEITPHQVLVTPAPGVPGRLPFWHGDAASRPLELGRAIGGFIDELSEADDEHVARMLDAADLDATAISNLRAYLTEQQAATSVVPGARHLLVERCRDELGDWRVLIHAAWGSAVLAPLALAVEARARDRYGIEARASATNDGIIVRIPDTDDVPPGAELLDISSEEVAQIVTDQVFGSALFAARFRECAARALLLPKRDPGRRAPLWQQRLKAAQLLQVASSYPDFPIVLETMRECLDDVFDLDGLVEQLRAVEQRQIQVVDLQTEQPSPFARNLLFSYVGEFVYEGDQPLAERVLAAAAVDPDLLAELLGGTANSADLLDPAVAAQVEAQVQRLSEHHRAESAESLWDVVRTLGPLTGEELIARASDGQGAAWVEQLAAAKRIAPVRVAGLDMWSTPDDLAVLRDGLGVSIPPGFGVEPVGDRDDALDRLVLRWVRGHTGSGVEQIAERYGLAATAVTQSLQRHRHGPVASRLQELDGRWWHPDLVRTVRRRALAQLRAEVEPVEPATLARFVADWQEVSQPASGPEALLAAVDALAGWPIPASMLEQVVLPARVADYQPAWLDDLLARGEVVWNGRGAIGTSDGWVQLWPADIVLPATPTQELTPRAQELLEALERGGAWSLAELCGGPATDADEDALWSLVWSGRITAASLAPLRELGNRGAALKRTPRPQVGRRRIPRSVRLPRTAAAGGRWSLVRPTPVNATERGLLAASTLLARHGVLTRGAVQADALFDSFSSAYRVLSAMEDTGGVRRGYFVEGLGAAQFALPGAVDRLRALSPGPGAEPAPIERAIVLAACDPANPYGAALDWPDSPAHRPTRKAGALVVLGEGQLLAYCERGLRTLITFTEDPETLVIALSALRAGIAQGRLPSITVEKVNGQSALTEPRLRTALQEAGFAMTPQGFRARAR